MFDYTALRVSDDVVKSLWVKTGGKENKAGIVEEFFTTDYPVGM